MRNGFIALAVLLGLVLAAPPASAAKRPLVGMGDQKVQMFDDPRLSWLGVKHARLVAPWYVATGVSPQELTYVDQWMAAAQRTGVKPLVGFGHGYEGKARTYLPKRKEFKAAISAFRKRYPSVRTYIPWNEANHCSQPTCKRPKRAAQYFDILKRSCRSCKVLAPAVLDQSNMVSWLRKFRRAARYTPRIYALHNYLDVNRKRSTGTRRFLRAVPRGAKVWIAETGGVVYRKHYRGQADFPENAKHAGKVTRFLMRMARKHKKIKRVYLYHWNAKLGSQWDSALVDAFGNTRPAFNALARSLGLNPLLAPPLTAPLPPPPPDIPIAENQAPATEQPESSQEGSSDQPSDGSQEEKPPPEDDSGQEPAPALPTPIDPTQCQQLPDFCQSVGGVLG